MFEDDIVDVNVHEILSATSAVITNTHVVYTSGKHGSTYVNKDAVYPHIASVSRLCYALSHEFKKDNVDVVIGPATGGIVLSQWVAFHLGIFSKSALSIYAEKSDDGKSFVIKRGYDKLVAGKNILVVEDVLNTGGSARKVIEAVRALNGNIVGLGVLCNRGGITEEEMDVPKLHSLLKINLDSWDEADCPLCAKGVPINTDVGKGREFLARKNAR
jgi:orotate phosphoribosyltransferase